jgi:predicted acylesterase/phospholipase RssA
VGDLGDGLLPSMITTVTSEDEQAVDATAVHATEGPRALIMKGGGIKGLTYVGALEILKERYQFNWYIGTSAGAIAAVLLGAGFSTDELKKYSRTRIFEISLTLNDINIQLT